MTCNLLAQVNVLNCPIFLSSQIPLVIPGAVCYWTYGKHDRRYLVCGHKLPMRGAVINNGRMERDSLWTSISKPLWYQCRGGNGTTGNTNASVSEQTECKTRILRVGANKKTSLELPNWEVSNSVSAALRSAISPNCDARLLLIEVLLNTNVPSVSVSTTSLSDASVPIAARHDTNWLSLLGAHGGQGLCNV